MRAVDPTELERARRKVEAGEKLTEAELDLLRTAAQSHGTVALRIAVAHALVDAGEPRQALDLLESLRRDAPREVQVRLGIARALASMERYSEAERSLHDALALNPGDPEALKALAVLALRRGEHRGAHLRIDEVLRVDPFDGEAQLLKAELETAEYGSGAPRPVREPPASRPQFAEALLERLKAQSTPHLLQGDQLVVRLGRGGVARLDLRSLHQGYLEEGRGLAEAIGLIARELAERALGVPEEREAVLERVMPVLRDAAMLDRAVGAVRREGPAGLWVFYVLDDSELVRYLPEGALESRGLTLDELDEAAWSNLDHRPAMPCAVDVQRGALSRVESPCGLWALADADGHDGPRLLCRAQQRILAERIGPGPYRVSLGIRELTLVCREADTAAVARLESLAPAENGLPGRFRLDESSKLVRLDPEPER